jgi:hypothetical protein
VERTGCIVGQNSQEKKGIEQIWEVVFRGKNDPVGGNFYYSEGCD